MRLERDPSLAEAPGFTTEQLDSLSRSIEAKQQKLEADINAYIKKKQRELALYEHELLAHYRDMECTQTRHPPSSASSAGPSPSSSSSASLPQADRAEDREKRPKHTRVHKREKELFGLVTPIFLPLLDARDAPPAKKKGERPEGDSGSTMGIPVPVPDVEMGSPPRDVDPTKERRSRGLKKSDPTEQLDNAAAVEKRSKSDSVKRPKRPATMKKSSLRSSNSDKSRRKRVSLVIDDQIVLPADMVPEPPLTSPSDTAPSSASTSTTSFEELIDPRLRSEDDSPRVEYLDTILDSNPSPTTSANTTVNSSSSSSNNMPSTLTKEPDTFLDRNPPTGSLSTSPSAINAPVTYEPPVTTGRTFLEPSPPKSIPARNIPQHASSAPIYASVPERAEPGGEEFSSYVGGISGSGVDNVNQAGSLGFPSSLGASYMESYMQSRPLSVRMAAAEKAGLSGDETDALVNTRRGRLDETREEDEDVDMDMDVDRRGDNSRRGIGEDEDMDVIGNMEDF